MSCQVRQSTTSNPGRKPSPYEESRYEDTHLVSEKALAMLQAIDASRFLSDFHSARTLLDRVASRGAACDSVLPDRVRRQPSAGRDLSNAGSERGTLWHQAQHPE